MAARDASSDPAPAAQAGPPPLTGSALAITSIALALGTFMQVLDGTIANVSLPTISGNLGVSTSQGTWVITSFAVAGRFIFGHALDSVEHVALDELEALVGPASPAEGRSGDDMPQTPHRP